MNQPNQINHPHRTDQRSINHDNFNYTKKKKKKRKKEKSKHLFFFLFSIFMLVHHKQYTVELDWLEHLRNHENMFETGVVRANEGLSWRQEA